MAKKIIGGEVVRSVAHGTIHIIDDNPAEAPTPPPSSPTPPEKPKKAARDKAPVAHSTEEFIKKYQGKRFTAKTAGKAYFLDFLFNAYKRNNQMIDIELWDISAIRSKIETAEDMIAYDSYYFLVEYLRTVFEQAMSVVKDLRLFISEFANEATTVLAGENLRNNIQGEQNTAVTLWLQSISLEAYTPQRSGGILFQSLRENIEQGLRYMEAYHTFIDVIADFTGVPECNILKMRVIPTRERLTALNEVLDCIRKNVEAHREPEIMEASAAGNKDFLPLSLTRWTPEYLKATMRVFQPIEEAAPVPEERIQYLRDSLRRDFKTSAINWYTLFYNYSIDYRIPYPAVTPPISPTDPGEIIEATIEVAEADND